jgi:hypothetical protein
MYFGIRAMLIDVSRLARPDDPRFVVIRTADSETIAATNDPEAARAAVRLLSL